MHKNQASGEVAANGVVATGAVANEVVAKNLHYSYPPLIEGGEPVPVLQGVDLSVARGEFVALLGRVGAGKTTLCMALNGLVPHVTGGVFQGDVTIAGQNTKEIGVAEIARSVGLVFQDPESQLVQMRVDDEVAFGLENLGVPLAEMEERVTWALNAVGLTALRGRSPLMLSGGEKQRVAIAAMLAMRPRVLVLDEPTASLDPLGKAAVFHVLASLRAHHDITILMATQDLERISSYADRVLVLHEGRIALQGPPDEVFAQVDLLQSFGIGVPQLAELAHLLARHTRRHYTFTTPATAYKELRRRARKIRMRKLRVLPAEPAEPVAQPFADRIHVGIENVSYTYDDGTPALRGVSLALRPGDFVALLGPNGAGKTTLAKHLNGLLRPATGRVVVENVDTRLAPVARLARSVGYAFQNPDHQIFASTVREEISFGLRMQELPASIIESRCAEVMERFQLGPYMDLPPALLGFGQRRKVALASIIAMQPKVLILDEPTGGLDWRSTQELMQAVAAFNAMGRTVVLITHDMRLVAEYANRAIVLRDGRLAFDGPTRDLFGQPKVLAQAQLTLPPVARLSRRLAREGMAADCLSCAEFVTAWVSRLASRRKRKKARHAGARRHEK